MCRLPVTTVSTGRRLVVIVLSPFLQMRKLRGQRWLVTCTVVFQFISLPELIIRIYDLAKIIRLLHHEQLAKFQGHSSSVLFRRLRESPVIAAGSESLVDAGVSQRLWGEYCGGGPGPSHLYWSLLQTEKSCFHIYIEVPYEFVLGEKKRKGLLLIIKGV